MEGRGSGLHQELLDLVKFLLGLGHPFEVVGFLQKPIEGETSFTEVRDKTAEHGEAPYNSMYPLYVLNQAHPRDGRDLLWVGFDATLGIDETKQHTPRDPENALLRVELNYISSEFCEGLLKVGYELVSPFGLDHDVVHVGLNGPPDKVLETLEHTMLVHGPNIL